MRSGQARRECAITVVQLALAAQPRAQVAQPAQEAPARHGAEGRLAHRGHRPFEIVAVATGALHTADAELGVHEGQEQLVALQRRHAAAGALAAQRQAELVELGQLYRR